MKKEGNIFTKILRNHTGYFDEIFEGDFVKQTGLSLLLAILLLFIYSALAISMFGWEQALLSGLKLPILFISSLILCFPTFYVFSALRGSELEPKEILGLFSGFLVYVSVLLIALLPINWLFLFSGSFIGLLAFLFFIFNMISVCLAISFLRNGVLYLDKKVGGRVDKNFIWIWLAVFALVMLQMASNLGPWFEENKRIFKDRKSFLEKGQDSDDVLIESGELEGSCVGD